jgi:hypothetical protein
MAFLIIAIYIKPHTNIIGNYICHTYLIIQIMGTIIDTIQICSHPETAPTQIVEAHSSHRKSKSNCKTNHNSTSESSSSTTSTSSTGRKPHTNVHSSAAKILTLRKSGHIWATEDNYTMTVGVSDNSGQKTLFIKCNNKESFLKWVNAIRKAKRPEWSDSSKCTNCHSSFNLLSTKHHCRMCGEVFCFTSVYAMNAERGLSQFLTLHITTPSEFAPSARIVVPKTHLTIYINCLCSCFLENEFWIAFPYSFCIHK